MNRELPRLIISVALLCVVLLTGCVEDEGVPPTTTTPTTTPSPSPALTHTPSSAAVPPQMQMTLSSPEFENGAPIPARFTCDGNDINPTLRIENVPAGTKSLALILEDPDAPLGTWVH